jgi:tetratricopeptide (TPR) repeat protein
MLNPRKKITRKEMKQDTLLTAYAQGISLYETYRKQIGYAVAAVAIIAIAIVIYRNNRTNNDEHAATELGKIFSIYDAAATNPSQYQVAINGMPEAGIMGLKSIVENYGNSPSGDLARFYLANSYFALGQYDDALEQYKKFDGDSPLLKASARAGIGACLEAKSDYAPAAEHFEKAASISSNAAIVPEYLNSAARCYGHAGNHAKAVALLKRIKQEFPTSTYARDADRYISQFSA